MHVLLFGFDVNSEFDELHVEIDGLVFHFLPMFAVNFEKINEIYLFSFWKSKEKSLIPWSLVGYWYLNKVSILSLNYHSLTLLHQHFWLKVSDTFLVWPTLTWDGCIWLHWIMLFSQIFIVVDVSVLCPCLSPCFIALSPIWSLNYLLKAPQNPNLYSHLSIWELTGFRTKLMNESTF